MNQTGQTFVALYCRTAHISYAAIQSQMARLKVYAEKQGFTNTRFFIDNGACGLNFDRPAFQRLIREIKAGNVSAVVARDFSRYGRDFCEMFRIFGELHDRYGVRFLSELDGEYDSDWIHTAINALLSEKGGARK